MESMVLAENEQDLNFQLNQYCRFCLCKPQKLVPLKSKVRTVPVPEMFTFLTGIEIDFEDAYPKKVCTVCIGKLGAGYAIRKEFLDNFATLQGLQHDVVAIKEEVLEEELIEDPVKQEEQADVVGVLEPEENLLSMNDEKSTKQRNESMTVLVEPVKIESGLSVEDSDTDYDDVDDVAEYQSSADEQAHIDGDPDFPRRKKKKIESDFPEPLKRRKRKHAYEGNPSEMNPNKCYICQKEFEGLRELNVHLPEHSDMLPYSCELCIEGGSQKDPIVSALMLHRHIRMHAGTIGCPYCPYRVFTVKTLKGHIERDHSERSVGEFTCEKCGYKLNSKRLYSDHMKRHEAVEEGKYACHICEGKFGTGPRLRRHLLTHEDKKFQCQYCSKYLRSHTLLLTHEREHSKDTGGAQYACEFCGMRFATQIERSYHLTTQHPEYVRKNTQVARTVNNKKVPKDLSCQVEGCGHQAKSIPGYYFHRYKHNPKFVCPFCSKGCPTRQELDIHVNTHTGLKPHACDLCDKKFNQKQHLVTHRRTHTGERPYLCTECGEAFESNKKLGNHVLQHSAPQHKCIPCNKSFRYKGDLTKHMKQKHADSFQDVEMIMDV